MTSPERFSEEEPIDIGAALSAVNIGMGPITASRRIIPKVAERQVVEFYSSLIGGRLLAMPRDSIDSMRHAVLQQHGLPVFDRTELHEDFTFLHVPIGAYPLRSRLKLAGSDLTRYGGILTSVTATQSYQYHAGLGVAASGEVPLLNRFAIVEDTKSATGLTPYLVPPYDVSEYGTPQDFADRLLRELADSNIFAADQMPHVQELLQQGVVSAKQG